MLFLSSVFFHSAFMPEHLSYFTSQQLLFHMLHPLKSLLLTAQSSGERNITHTWLLLISVFIVNSVTHEVLYKIWSQDPLCTGAMLLLLVRVIYSPCAVHLWSLGMSRQPTFTTPHSSP